MTMAAAPHATLVRLWSPDWVLAHSVPEDRITAHTPEGCVLTLPWTLRAAEWLVNARGAHITIDDEQGRWTAPLEQWEIRRVGECPHCAHCMEKIVVAKFRHPQSSCIPID